MLPLFPLQAVLFPGGLLRLKVFEARYLDLIGRCLRDQSPFGVMCLRQGSELRQAGSAAVQFESLGVLAQVQDVDAEQAGILKVSCIGGQRIGTGLAVQRDDGLWQAEATLLADDAALAPPPEHHAAVAALAKAIEALRAQGQRPFIEPYHLNDAGWVANRWCEILPISLLAKHKLMALDDPLIRLKLVADFLHSRGLS